MKVTVIKDKNGVKKSVQIPFNEWKKHDKEYRQLLSSHKTVVSKKKRKRESSENDQLRNFSADVSSFTFWKNKKEDLYQDFLNNK